MRGARPQEVIEIGGVVAVHFLAGYPGLPGQSRILRVVTRRCAGRDSFQTRTHDNTMNSTYYIGLDVHKEKTAIAYALEGSREDAIYYGTCGGSVPNTEVILRRLARKLGVDFKDLKVCYEAGPTGFVLARRLLHLGLECVVIAPTKTERKPGEKIKTDRRDAQKLAKLYRNGDLTPVHIPPASDEAVRDVCRARTDAVEDVTRSKQRLKSFLLRNGFRPKFASWSEPYFRYLRDLVLPDAAQKVVLEEYLQAVESGLERVSRLELRMLALLEDWEWQPVVRALMAFKGFQEVAAMITISELGDLTRFSHPRQLMAFLGLVPSEDSTGSKRRQGGITKCGNAHARWILIESAQAYRNQPKVSAQLSKRQQGQSGAVKELSWRAQHRLSHRYRRLKARGKQENKVIAAVARELCAFVWELHQLLRGRLPASNPTPPTS
jgi:transposase